MRSIIGLTIFFSFFFIPLFAQKHIVKLSNEIKLGRNVNFIKHLHSDTSGHYLQFSKHKGLFKGERTTPIIKKFNKNFKEVFSKNYKISKDDVYDLGIRYFKNKFIWLYYWKDKKTLLSDKTSKIKASEV